MKYRRTTMEERDELFSHELWSFDGYELAQDWRSEPVLIPSQNNIERLSDWLTARLKTPVQVKKMDGMILVQHLMTGKTICCGKYLEDAALWSLDCGSGGSLC